MDQEQAGRFLAAAQQDYERCVREYVDLVSRVPNPVEEDDYAVYGEARGYVLAAQQVLHLARYEVEHAAEREREQAALYTCGLCGGRTSSLQYVAGSGPGVCEDCYRRDGQQGQQP
jgi:hypothetical protein